eukprot:524603_1
MGTCCQSQSPMVHHSTQISQELRQHKKMEYRKKKLLILGPKYSGKSTIFNQIKYLHGNGFDNEHRRQSKHQIHCFIIHSMQQIIECVEEYETYKQFAIHKFTLNKEAQTSAQYIKHITLNNAFTMTNETSNHIQTLRKQNAIRKIVNNASEYYIDVSFEYFFDQFERISASNYIPSDEDIIKLRLKSDGFNETMIEIGGLDMVVYDINYKPDICTMNKYMHCFEDVTAIIFVASLCCFDEPIFEDDTSYKQKLEWERSMEMMTSIVGNDILHVIMSFIGQPRNSMKESLDVFDTLCNHTPWFNDTPVLLFLSKSDLFTRKINEYAKQTHDHNPFRDCFPDFKAKYDFTECSEYISHKFSELNETIDGSRTVYVHCVNGTDSTLMTKIFADTQSVIIESSLRQAGLMG